MILRALLVLAICALFAGCATTRHKAAAYSPAFAVDQFLGINMEYSGSRTLIGADIHGPTQKEFECQRDMASALSQPAAAGHRYVTDCLHVKFVGPLPRGAAVPTPPSGKPFEYLTIGAEYSGVGDFVGAQALHPAPDLKTCIGEARDLLDSNYKDGTIPAANSMLLYCLPVPILDTDPNDDGGIL